MNPERWIAPTAGLAALQIAVGAAGAAGLGLALLGGPGAPISAWFSLLQMLAFAASGSVLLFGGQTDRRAAYLGVVFLLIAATFGQTPGIALLGALPEGLALSVSPVVSLRVHAFLPVFLWLFVRDFPRALTSRRTRRVISAAIATSVVAGSVLALVNSALDFGLLPDDASALLEPLVSARHGSSQYYTLVYGLTLIALVVMVVKTQSAAAGERRRVTLFVAGLLVGAIPPVVVIVLAAIWPAFDALVLSPTGRNALLPALQIPILLVPVATAYAVRVHRVMDVRFFVRKVVEYGLARSTLVAVTALPIVLLVWTLYDSRHLPLAELLRGPRSLATFAIAALGGGLLWLHPRAIDAIDRFFFREDYDARQILLSLSLTLREGCSAGEVGHLVTDEIDRALHLDGVDLLALDGDRGELVSTIGRSRPLPRTSPLAAAADAAAGPLDTDIEHAALPGLPVAEREWIADVGCRLLVPVRGGRGSLIGVLALGARRSELPFKADDLHLLDGVAEATGRALATIVEGVVATAPGRAEPGAGECASCGFVGSTGGGNCPECGAALETSALPQNVLGKFRLERRAGSGGMGVVYRATDISLGRTVAIKTLPRVSPEDALHLRREARAMASVAHPNLALVFGAEAWYGTPLLVLEFFGGGTLDDRLHEGPLPLPEVLALGRIICDVLSVVHAAGILHGDIKPSNVGYTEAGEPKLLDFGLARMLSMPDGASAAASLEELSGSPRATTSTKGFVGTPMYMSPEAIWGEAPDVSMDLWSTCAMLFEALAGRHPFEHEDWNDTLYAITRGHCLDLRKLVDDCLPTVATFFEGALARDRVRRPQSARALARTLQELDAQAGAA